MADDQWQRSPLAIAATSSAIGMQATLHSCSCFKLCSEKDLRSFHLRLPKVTSRESPWFSYLSWVYKDGRIPLPVDLSTFEFFYLALLPVEWRCSAQNSQGRNVQPLPTCAPEQCARWLHPAEPSDAQLKAHEKEYWPPRSFQWHRSRFPRLMWNQTLRFIKRVPNETFYRSSSVLEVTRHSKLFHDYYDWCAQGSSVDENEYVGNPKLGAAEGVGYGCWFTPSIGTGVFIEMSQKRTIYLVDRLEAERKLPEILRFPLRTQNTSFATRGGKYVTIQHKDCLYATATRSRHKDRLFIEHNPEMAPHLIVASNECMQQAQPLQTGCVPSGDALQLKTGWDGTKPCHCHDDVSNDSEGLSTVLNCAGLAL